MTGISSHNSPQLVAIGNAIIDMCFLISDETLHELDLEKGSMTLIDDKQLRRLYNTLDSADFITPGGSAANTVVGFSVLLGNSGYIGRVGNDDFAEMFKDKMAQYAITKINHIAHDRHTTATCIILITPDGERTMATYLGVCSLIETTPNEEIWASNAKILFLEGYLCGSDLAYDSMQRCIGLSAKNHNQIVLSLGSTSCVSLVRNRMLQLIDQGVNTIVGTIDEGILLSGDQTIEKAIAFFQAHSCKGALTDGANGSYVFNNHEMHHVPALTAKTVVDTTGAGDQFAAGYLFGLLNNKPITECARLGNECALKVLGKIGAHP